METLEALGNCVTDQLHKGHKLQDLRYLIETYNGTDWESFIKFSNEKYLKNNVFSNDQIDIFVICWNNNQKSGIHDHPENGCLLRLMQGSLQEDVYVKNNNDYEHIRTNYLHSNGISYKEGKSCIHNIINGDQKTVSLHIYSPSNYKTVYY
ncbi:cysteine dioxygenase type I [Fadolivirus algeromassiliense]|jgi:cysteine dioxygenase|uniref:Cysteine dioxygenase type I n=1 Tax=Fadolivirus FV1/VV64 TaxID=3070911 RepID=A0A7D3R098_9VIRU|nr:cysteine dioxygenase type I [Fadolivirus algeromassiliense]QKF93501.1 cysteine dioxygenase type I [Fadolivirus FV1/VV64]